MTSQLEPRALTPPHFPGSDLRRVLRNFVHWLEGFGDRSQDQYDVWASTPGRWAKRAYYRQRALGLPLVAPFVLIDAGAPILRRFLRSPSRFPIADAHYAMGFFALAAEQGENAETKGRGYLDALERSSSPQTSEWAWGYPFDWETCFGTFEAGRPLITTTPYCYEAFEAGYAATGSARYLEIMESTARFCHDHIASVSVGPRSAASAYTTTDVRRVVNASAYRAFLLTTAGRRFGRDHWLEAGRANAAFVLESQRDDGSWLYAVDGKDAFIDNFHTCFVLKNLFKIWRETGEEEVGAAISRGYDFYCAHLLDTRGAPVPFARTQRFVTHHADLYDYAEGVNLAWLLRDFHPAAGENLVRLVEAVLANWVLPDGHFLTRRLLLGRPNEVPYHRWAQSQMFRALAVAYEGA